MKITLKDFGPISHFEFDLEKDMHVIFGKNNIGKSYAITAVYLILKNLMLAYDRSFVNIEKIFLDDSNHDRLQKKYKSEFNDALIEIQKGPYGCSVVNEIVEPLFSSLLNQVFIQDLENSFKNSFISIDKLSNQFSAEKFKISIDSKGFIVNITTIGNALIIESLKIKTDIIADVYIADNWKSTTFYYNNDKGSFLDLLLTKVYYGLADDVLSIIGNVYFLPSSRSGLYQALNSFSALMVELSKSRNFLTAKIELPNISEPVSDYFLNLSTISNTPSKTYNDIIATLENDILQGEILFNNDNKKVFFRQHKINVDFDLSHTSSMVSEVAPIVAYLKFVVGNRNAIENSTSDGLVFIEEPEAHLHPEIQVKLMEMFALLAGKNIKIVMTSHSNYMFNKLSNLLLENKIDHNRVASYLMRATEKGSVTDMLSMKAEADGMNDENFAGTAEMLYEERIRMYDKLNSAKDAD